MFKLITLCFTILILSQAGFSQAAMDKELGFEVNRIYPYISISSEELKQAKSVEDLDPHFKPSWVRKYISVEISAINNGNLRKAIAENTVLSAEQKDIMKMSDAGTAISVIVRYMPENTLKHNDPKEFDFTFTVEPESDANYIGGQQQLEQYLQEKAIDKIPEGTFQGYAVAAVQFAIGEEGEITDVQVFESSKDEKIDELLLETIRKMPCWKPAEYSDGTKIKQEFVLTVGSMENCMVNLLNIRRN